MMGRFSLARAGAVVGGIGLLGVVLAGCASTVEGPASDALQALQPGASIAKPWADASYDAADADFFQWPVLDDIRPPQPAARTAHAAAIAQMATIYGSLPVEQYKQMYAQAIDTSDPDYTGFNVFDYDENLATPGYRDFKTPNVDTLYFNAWLDLTDGPVVVSVPETDGRFYTVNFLDAYGNATNISSGTAGSAGGEYLIATTQWSGPVPDGMQVFRVTTPYQWILGRVFTQGGADLQVARDYQKQFTISAPAASTRPASDYPSPRVDGPQAFFDILDFILDQNGYPVEEAALVNQFRAIGVGEDVNVADALADAATAAGVGQGYVAGWQVIRASLGGSGTTVGAWRVPTDSGRYGLNYLTRSGVIRATGANVVTEYYPFVTSFDSDGAPLNGGQHSYDLVLPSEPPVDYFWSLIPYDAMTAELYPNALEKYEVGDRTEGLVYNADGSLTIRLQTAQPDDAPHANWLPVPAGPFYLVLRNQGAKQEFYDTGWAPGAVTKVTTSQD